MINTRLTNILRNVIISEKANLVSEQNNCYIFKVLPDANKNEIKKAVETLYNAKVKSVNTVNVAGKKRRTAHGYGVRSDWKKAYVTLQQGEKIEMFQADKESN